MEPMVRRREQGERGGDELFESGFWRSDRCRKDVKIDRAPDRLADALEANDGLLGRAGAIRPGSRRGPGQRWFRAGPERL
jgi:hypothetical protein